MSLSAEAQKIFSGGVDRLNNANLCKFTSNNKVVVVVVSAGPGLGEG